jgi:hypothetical protein
MNKKVLLEWFALAPIVTESFLRKNAIFCWCKKATNGSSFYALQKKDYLQKLEVESWIGFLLVFSHSRSFQ